MRKLIFLLIILALIIPFVSGASYLSTYDSNRVLLLHMNGSDNGDIFIDENGKTVTPHNAVTKTAVKNFGTASGYFPSASTAWLDTPDSADFSMGSGDFTILAWVKQNSNAGSQTAIGQASAAGGEYANIIRIIDGVPTYEDLTLAAGTGNAVGPTISDTNWHQLVVIRSGTSLTFYTDGTAGTVKDVTGKSGKDSAAKFAVGRYGEYTTSQYFNGYIDEVAIWKGVAISISELYPQLYEINGATGDTTPPNSITSLTNNTEKCNEVKWSWTNPTNTDYNYLYTLKNDVWTSNYTNSTTTINWSGTTGLLKFSSKTVDLKGNINVSWVNQTANITVCASPSYPTGSIQLNNCGKGNNWLAWCYTNSTNITQASLDGNLITNFDNLSSMYIAQKLEGNSSHIFYLFGTTNNVFDINTTLADTQTNKESFFSIILIYLLFLLGCFCIVIGISYEPIIGFGAFIFGVIGITTSLNNSFIMGSLFFILIVASIFVVFKEK